MKGQGKKNKKNDSKLSDFDDILEDDEHEPNVEKKVFQHIISNLEQLFCMIKVQLNSLVEKAHVNFKIVVFARF